ncbi:non-ribosomal peptide synthetase [Enterobacillus tribolii]|uniref:Non-ribosomal peptide synthetase component F n=1 Tax=Enterobacillus tribolii TaxID=1487935 RepID=A0A370QNU2_9GAMM|nr:condensation domain-containing protein [Enterobacillus tribolii]MBW7981947.1 hypothetical protein [Enterobacillus tribolii]RDK90034.1 non-ribosomal peptide synthetase component F [Enterobacillus tribolii]
MKEIMVSSHAGLFWNNEKLLNRRSTDYRLALDPAEGAQPIVALGRRDYPLSWPQMRLWYSGHPDCDDALNHVPMLFRLDERTNITALCRGMQAVVARHSCLNSVFETAERGQVRTRSTGVALEVTERVLSDEEWDACLCQDVNAPFDPATTPPVRAVIYRRSGVDGVRYYLLLVFHHLVFDDASRAILLNELEHCYQAYRRGEEPALAPLSLQYGDYAVWQRGLLGSASMQARRAWWWERLKGWQPLTLPLDFRRPARFEHRGVNYAFSLPPELTARVVQVARRECITPFALYLAGFNLLLAAFSGQRDILVGTPAANRPSPQTRQLIGFFANTLPLRSRIDDDVSPSVYLRTVFKSLLQARRHQQLPLEQLLEMLSVPRDPSVHPLFQVMFTLTSAQDVKMPEWMNAECLLEYHQVAERDLTFSVMPDDAYPCAVINYATALFAPDTIACLADYYLRIMHQLLDEKTRRIGDITLIPAQAIADMRTSWQDRPYAYEFERPIWCDFVTQAQHAPQAIAVIDELGELSYGDLYRAALTLAAQLRTSAAMDGEAIAVLVDKGRAQVIAILGCSLAGMAFLPMDNTWSEIRRRDAMRQVNARLVISSHPWSVGAENTLVMISPQGQVAALPEPEHIPGPVKCAPDDPAYMIFSTDATGVITGVAVEHRSAVNSIIDVLGKMSVKAGERGFAVSALSSGISIFAIFGLLSAGGTLIMPGEKTGYQPDAWLHLIIRHRVSFWSSSPTAMTQLTEHIESQPVQPACALSKVMLAGEAVAAGLPARIRDWAPGCRVASVGGAPEGAAWSIYYEIPDAPIDRPGVPYGIPMCHQRLYVLDRCQRPLPAGLPGELYIGGEGVARCYLNNPALSDARFIWHDALGERLFRTGERVRWLPDGQLERLGRMDGREKNGGDVELPDMEHSVQLV